MKRTRLTAVSLPLVALFVLGPGPASADRTADRSVQSVQVAASAPGSGLRGGASGGPRIRANVKSLSAMRWEDMVRQEIDIGCGAASLATILTYYFDFPTTEDEMYRALMAQALREAGPDTREVGFNLHHIRTVALRGGLSAAAFHVAPEDLERVRIPAIARVTIHGYNHFVVFKQAIAGRVYVADPAFGNTSYRLPAFKRMWSGVLMGFVRRGSDRPLDHDLLVTEGDHRAISPDELGRLALAASGVSAPAPKAPTFSSFSTFGFFSPSIAGLESVFPTFLTNDIEF